MKTGKANINFLMIFIMIFFVALFVRIGQLAINKNINDINLVSYYENKKLERSSVPQVRRGTIFDSMGTPIAMDATSYYLEATLKNPGNDQYVKDRDITAKILSKHLGMDFNVVLDVLLTPEQERVFLGNLSGFSLDTKKAIDSEKLPGIKVLGLPRRYYLNDYYASHLIGYTKERDIIFDKESGTLKIVAGNELENLNILIGDLGVEKVFDEQLNGYFLNREGSSESDVVGLDITLTLDSRLQNPLEKLMDEYAQKYSPQALQLYLVDMETGKLLSAAQRPTFNLNNLDGINNEWKNLMVADAYEPGSTIKTLTTAVSYDRQLFTPLEVYQSGSIQVYDQIVKDHNVVGWGAITFEEGFARSSNVAMVNLVQRMGDQNWVNKLLEFGFGSETQFELDNEISGATNFDSPVTRIMSGFGQGFSATPIQLLQAFSSIGNNGEMLKIQVVDKVATQNYFHKNVIGRPISPEAAHYVMKLMVDTVEKPYGTAQAFENPTMRVAAKTGTAQIASPDGNGYLKGENDYYHSAVVFFPAEAPKYMMYLSMKQPSITYGQIGSQILGELFNRFANIVMMYE